MNEAPIRSSPLWPAETEWFAFWQSIPSVVQVTAGMLYGYPSALLRDAIVSYHAAAMFAAEVSCRATVESAGFVALTSVRVGPGTWGFDWPLDLKGDVRWVEFREAKEGLSTRDILQQGLLERIELIQKHGNFVAHLAARKAAELHRIAKTPPSPGSSLSELWVAPAEVRSDVDTAKDVLRELFTWSHSRPPVWEWGKLKIPRPQAGEGDRLSD
jgi:hypothetical protein